MHGGVAPAFAETNPLSGTTEISEAADPVAPTRWLCRVGAERGCARRCLSSARVRMIAMGQLPRFGPYPGGVSASPHQADRPGCTNPSVSARERRSPNLLRTAAIDPSQWLLGIESPMTAYAPYRTLGSSTRLRAELRHSKVRCERAGTVNDPEVGNRLRRDIDRDGVELVSFGANTAEQPQQISITGKLGTPGNDPGDLPLPASSGACVGSPCPPPAAAARRGCAFKFGEVRRGVDDCGMGEGLREIP